MKRSLVENYIGAIALGILLADAILEFVGIFVTPVASWATRKTLQSIVSVSGEAHPLAPRAFPFRDALPPLCRFVLLFGIWCLLFLWLYARPAYETSEAKIHSESVPSE